MSLEHNFCRNLRFLPRSIIRLLYDKVYWLFYHIPLIIFYYCVVHFWIVLCSIAFCQSIRINGLKGYYQLATVISHSCIATSVIGSLPCFPAREWMDMDMSEGVALITDFRLTKFEFVMPLEDSELALWRAEILDSADRRRTLWRSKEAAVTSVLMTRSSPCPFGMQTVTLDEIGSTGDRASVARIHAFFIAPNGSRISNIYRVVWSSCWPKRPCHTLPSAPLPQPTDDKTFETVLSTTKDRSRGSI